MAPPFAHTHKCQALNRSAKLIICKNAGLVTSVPNLSPATTPQSHRKSNTQSMLWQIAPPIESWLLPFGMCSMPGCPSPVAEFRPGAQNAGDHPGQRGAQREQSDPQPCGGNVVGALQDQGEVLVGGHPSAKEAKLDQPRIAGPKASGPRGTEHGTTLAKLGKASLAKIDC